MIRVVQAPAKLNLRLKIEGRLENGYHLLSMLNVTVDLCDELIVEFCRGSGVRLCDVVMDNVEADDGLLDPGRNLAVRAAEQFLRSFEPPFGVELTLKKKIPLAAGLGGGSSDAAAVLNLLARQYLSMMPSGGREGRDGFNARLNELALRLGADVPFFLKGGFSHVGRVGEAVQVLNWQLVEGLRFLLLVPALHVPTEEVYALCRRRAPHLGANQDVNGRKFVSDCLALRLDDRQGIGCSMVNLASLGCELRRLIENDLETVVCEKYQQVFGLLHLLRNCGDTPAAMSGSGGAVFCLQDGLSPDVMQELEGRQEKGEIRMHKVKPFKP